MASLDDAASWVSSQINVLKNLSESMIPIQQLIIVASYVIGLMFAFKAIYSLKVYGESRSMMSSNSSAKEPIIYLIVAAMFLYFPDGLHMMLSTTFGGDSALAIPTGDSRFLSHAMRMYLTIIMQTIGLIAFIHGWILIARAASQGQPPGGTGKGLMHVFGGVLAMNIVKTIEIIQNTFYGS